MKTLVPRLAAVLGLQGLRSSLWRRLANPAAIFRLNPDEATRRLLSEAAQLAELRAGLARVSVAVLLLLTIAVAVDEVPRNNPVLVRQLQAAQITIVLFGIVGVIGWWLASRRRPLRFLPVATATTDAVLVLGNIAYNLRASGIAGDFVAAMPALWVVPIMIAASAVHYRPRLQAYVTLLYIVGLSALILNAGSLELSERPQALAHFGLEFGPQANFVRLAMLLAMALILIIVAWQGRALLERAVRETTMRLTVARYLPAEFAPILSNESFAALRKGRRQEVVILFVDMRDSSALAETLDPARLAVFISSFRRRVSRAAAQHGGVVDKFIGDGALILFGVPAEGNDDAARALACGRTLIRLVERWNRKRRFDPPIRIGLGIHAGEVFCGVVGDESRLEFTVVGEAVNIANRIEQANKEAGTTMLASAEVVARAGEIEAWEPVGRDRLPGMTRQITLMRPNPDRPERAG
ncbi:adenylate/guanylate cyclase domain-containing protein [Microvirga massiliensis]|uniref:adenylate/guanylate cyclase domain-containing protein n=1 Tax=Microvirga massiliensis TaxID=1033741 RepID=UPI00065F90A3|nr:adenylate/guanylate cyclase domain-containing protein [Microvirga massiliensis]